MQRYIQNNRRQLAGPARPGGGGQASCMVCHQRAALWFPQYGDAISYRGLSFLGNPQIGFLGV